MGAIFEYIRDVNLAFEQGGDARSAKEALCVLDEVLGVLGIEFKRGSDPTGDRGALAQAAGSPRQRRTLPRRMRCVTRSRHRATTLKDTPEGVKINKR